ncbi:hypothetical protein FO519_007491 [Halicephalobus sp. NKZ332]|nr:hypothetical protein FO519_007491 [Halicephalobus sp. NKZ332]
MGERGSGEFGIQLLKKLLKIPHENELRFPEIDEVFRYKEEDFQREDSITIFSLARKKIGICWGRWTTEDDVEATRLQNIIREINVHLRYTPDTDEAVKYLIGFYGFGIGELEINICMELMEGSLSKLMGEIHKKYDLFPLEILQYTAVVLVKALDYLKSNLKVIHRDIKPDNVLYKLDDPGCIKLADFGISRTLVNSKATTMVATMNYMPPERFVKEILDYGVESDIWGIGIVLLELVNNRHPLLDEGESSDNNIARKLSKLKAGFPVPKGNLDPEGHEFISLCLKPFEQRPNQYSTLKDMDYVKNFREEKFKLTRYVEQDFS